MVACLEGIQNLRIFVACSLFVTCDIVELKMLFTIACGNVTTTTTSLFISCLSFINILNL